MQAILITALVLMTALQPLYAEGSAMKLMSDIEEWVNTYLERNIQPDKFSELIGDGKQVALVDNGFLEFNARNPLLKGGYIFFSKKKRKILVHSELILTKILVSQ